MRRCIIHLGMHKTGTTSIQRAMRGYDDGVTAYAPLDDHNHSLELMAMFLSQPKPRETAAARAGIDPGTLPSRIARFDAAMAASDRHMILSGEGLSLFPDRDSVSALTTLLRRHFGRITALAYVRAPKSFMQSSFQQQLRVEAPGFDPFHQRPRYRQRFRHWIRDLGRENVELVEYLPARLQGDELIEDFAARTGLPLPFRGTAPARANESLSATATAALFAHRRAQGRPGSNGFPPAVNTQLVQHLLLLGGDRFAYADEAAAPALRDIAEDVAWIEARLGHAFHPDLPRPGTHAFATPDDLLRHAERELPALYQWLRERVGFPGPAPSTAVGVIETACVHLAARAPAMG
jgi:hypothetical protein